MKKTKTKIITIAIAIIVVFLFLISPIARATINPDDYKPGEINSDDIEPVTNIASAIVNSLAVIGTVVSVITLIVIGIKYMMGSVEEKAEYKKTMIPYIVGAFMIFGITQFLKIIVEMVNSFD